MGKFTVEFYRTRERDDAHAILDKVLIIAHDLEAAKTKASSMFDNLDLPQKPDGFRVLGDQGDELCRWSPES